MGHDNRVPGLASIRRNRGLSLEQISQNTKISVRALQAIEEGEFKKLPGGIYNTSYIRQYARAIEFDESELLAYYHRTTEIVPPSFTPKYSASCGFSASLSIPSTGLRQLIRVRGISGMRIEGMVGISGMSGASMANSLLPNGNAMTPGCRWPMVAVSV